MKKRAKSLLALLMAFVMMFGTSLMAFAETGVENSAYTSGLCEHHTEHNEDCGYQPAVEGTPCSHEHTDECYETVKECVHEHDGDCYEKVLVCENEEEEHDEDCYEEVLSCDHECSEESGCITETLNCTHEHDEACGYQPAVEGAPCGYVCELCGADDDSTEPTNEEETSLPADDPSDETELKDGQKTFTVAQVEAMIDALPDVEYVEVLDPEEDAETLEEIYLQAADAADAFDTLSDEDQEKVSNLDKLMELHEWFNGGVATMDESVIDSGTFANSKGVPDAFTWTLYNDGGNLKLEITGTGDMPYWSSDNVPWNYYRGTIKAVSIGNGVTSIGENAFNSCVSLTSVELPDSLTKIGDSAFYNCMNLKSVKLPAGLKIIGSNAFNNCNTALESITIPESVTEIGVGAFQWCSVLKTVTFGGNSQLNKLGAQAFSNCKVLESITIPAGVTTIGVATFDGCTALKSITIPESVETIGGGAFQYCSALESITIPESVTKIDGSAFNGCTGLTTVTFAGTTPPANIASTAFSGCNNITKIEVPKGAEAAYCATLEGVIDNLDEVLPIENRIFAFSGVHTTLKDLASELPAGYKWEDDSIKLAVLGTAPKKLRIVSEDDKKEDLYVVIMPYNIAVTAQNAATGAELGAKLEKGNSVYVVPDFTITGDTEALEAAGFSVNTSMQETTAANKISIEKTEDGKYKLTGLAAGKETVTVKCECVKDEVIVATYSKTYTIDVIDSAKKGIAYIQVSLVTKDAEGQDKPVSVNEDDGVYHVAASDKLYLKNETVPYDGTGKINTVKFTSSDTAIAKVGKVTGAYTELIPVTSGYAVITAKAADTLGTTKDIVVKVGPAKNDKDEVVYDNTNILLNEYVVTLNTLSSDIAGTVEVITPSGEKITGVTAVNAKGIEDTTYGVSFDDSNKVTIKGTQQSKTGKIYLKVTLDDAKSSVVTIKNPVTVTVKKTAPKLNIKQSAKLDTYYKDGKAELIISVPGEKITAVTVNEESKYKVTVKPEELGKSSINGEISLKDDTQAAELKNTSVTVSVSLEGFADPLKKVIKVGTMQSATALSATSGTVYKGKNNTLITRVMNKNTKSAVDLMEAEEVSCNSENYEITPDTVRNELKITPKKGLAKGKSEKITITVKAKEMQFAKTYTYTVKYADASSMALEIKNKSLGLYKYDDKNDTARTVITLKGGTGSDILESIQWKPASTAKTEADYAKLGIETSYSYEAGVLLVKATVIDNSIKAGSYKYTFCIPKDIAGTRKDISTVLTVKVTDATGKKAPAVKATIKGKLDTVNRTAGVDIIPKFTNVRTDDATVTAVLTGRDAHLFEIGEDGKLYIDKGANVLTKYKYQIKIKYTVQREDLTFVCTTPAINITLSQSKPKVYATKLTAFSATMQDTKEVKLSIQNAKGEQLDIEKIQVVNTNSAFTVVTDAETGTVSVKHNPMTGKTKKGKSYKITLQIYPEGSTDNEKPVTITCPVKIAK